MEQAACNMHLHTTQPSSSGGRGRQESGLVKGGAGRTGEENKEYDTGRVMEGGKKGGGRRGSAVPCVLL